MKNIGIIGPGGISDRAHAPALAKLHNAQLWSVLSRDRDRAAAFAKRHYARADHAAHNGIDAFLNDDALDAVIIATPDRLHADQVIACAEAGKHVLCEKPMAATPEEAQRMIDACASQGVVLAIAYHLRWHSGHRRLHAQIQSGLLGEVRHMRVQWPFYAADANNWRAQAQVGRWWSLAAVGTHCLDQIRWMMMPSCGEIKRVNGLTSHGMIGSDHDETAILTMEFASGATAELCSSVRFAAPTRSEIYGSSGYAVCDGTLGANGAGRISTHDGDFPFPVTDPFEGEIDDFIQAIDTGKKPEVDGAEGLANVAILAKFASDAN